MNRVWNFIKRLFGSEDAEEEHKQYHIHKGTQWALYCLHEKDSSLLSALNYLDEGNSYEHTPFNYGVTMTVAAYFIPTDKINFNEHSNEFISGVAFVAIAYAFGDGFDDVLNYICDRTPSDYDLGVLEAIKILFPDYVRLHPTTGNFHPSFTYPDLQSAPCHRG